LARFTVTAELAVNAPDLESAERVKEVVFAAISPDHGNIIWQSLPKGVEVVGLHVDKEEG